MKSEVYISLLPFHFMHQFSLASALRWSLEIFTEEDGIFNILQVSFHSLYFEITIVITRT